MQQCLNDSNFAHNVCFHLSCRPKAFNAMLMSLSNAGFLKLSQSLMHECINVQLVSWDMFRFTSTEVKRDYKCTQTCCRQSSSRWPGATSTAKGICVSHSNIAHAVLVIPDDVKPVFPRHSFICLSHLPHPVFLPLSVHFPHCCGKPRFGIIIHGSSSRRFKLTG